MLDGVGEEVGVGPEAGAGQEVVFHAGAGELFDVLIGEVVVDGGADVLVGEVDAADAFVVGRERDGDVIEAVDGEGVVVAFDAEDALVGAEVDFNHDVFAGHFAEKLRGVVLVHDIDAVAEALGVAELDGLADVEAEAFRRDEAGGEFAGVEADVDLGVEGVEVVEHLHLEGVVAHGDESVFRHDEVDADPGVVMRVDAGLDGLEAEKCLGEDLLWSEATKDLVDIADFNLAGGCGLRGSAVLNGVARSISVEDRAAVGGDFVKEAKTEEFLTEGGEVSVPAGLVSDLGGVAEGRRMHQFEILLVLGGGTGGEAADSEAPFDRGAGDPPAVLGHA